jgi:hypothetical protein
MSRLKPEHYVDNKKFYEALVEYRKQITDENPNPPIPAFIVECVSKIGHGLAMKPNYANYSYLDDMILDGLEDCIRYIKSFNPEKSNNPFSYFTQATACAFWRRIKKEKKESYIKHKLYERMSVELQLNNEDSFGSTSIDNYDSIKLQDLYDSVEKSNKPKRIRNEGLTKFFE